MQRLEVSGAVRPIYGSLGFKRIRHAKRLMRWVRLYHYAIFRIILLLRLLYELTQTYHAENSVLRHTRSSSFPEEKEVVTNSDMYIYVFHVTYWHKLCQTRWQLTCHRFQTSHKQRNKNWRRNWRSLIAETYKNGFRTLRIGDGPFFPFWQY